MEKSIENKTLGELVTLIPSSIPLLRRYKLDFCCVGQITLKEACSENNLDLNKLCKELGSLQTSTNKNQMDYLQMPLSELCNHIIQRFHFGLKMRLPELLKLAEKVEHVHAQHLNCPTGLKNLLEEIHNEVLDHMYKEENILFPMIQSGAGGNAHMPIKVMNMEHESHGKQMQLLSKLTNDMTPPEDACNSWRVLYKGIDEMVSELMEHIHIENNILFPRALSEGNTTSSGGCCGFC